MKKVLVLVLALALLCSSALAAEIGFLPPAMTSPFYCLLYTSDAADEL